ncbi:hypothetical protein CC80DRAFT_190551 [Byssothecium circinans]|uniref:Uncharacterized protein n=1 Tax=Byssothecium circinans TaxID=147558 RepID=A0A6A5TJV4_9PLEO|nr:hypothetical protein CC80DRAFT_190551 [Byssothecium circinans]
MDFENFTESSLNSLRLTWEEKRMVRLKLAGVRKQYEKTFFGRYATQGRYLEPFVFQQLWLQPSTAQSHLNRKITVVCMPFFLLEDRVRYIRLQSPTNHAPLTLLQSDVSTIETDRDLRQVICKSVSGQRHRAFYVSQLWCLILDDGKILTYTRLPEQELCGNVVTSTKEPTRGTPYAPFIKVTDGGNCTWKLRLDDCKTWFDFTANFMEISSSVSELVRRFEDIFRVTMHDRVVELRDWGSVVQRARESPIHLVLARQKKAQRIVRVDYPVDDGDSSTSVSDSGGLFPWQMDGTPPVLKRADMLPSYQDYARGLNVFDVEELEKMASTTTYDFASTSVSSSRNAPEGLIKPEGNDKSSELEITPNSSDVETTATAYCGVLQALACFPHLQQNSSEPTNDARATSIEKNDLLSDLLTALHGKLLRSSHDKERKAYTNGPSKTLPEVTKYLTAFTYGGEPDHQGITELDTFFIAAVRLFEFFLPLENVSEIAKRYWGCVHFIMKHVLGDPVLFSSRSTTRSINIFKRVAHFASILQKEIFTPQGPDLNTTKLPDEFRKAWIHCVLSLVLFRFRNANIRELNRHNEKCEALLDRGRKLLWRASVKVPLHHKEVATPLALLSVIITNLVKDINRPGQRLDIADTYREYWRELELNIEFKKVKTAQADIVNLQQEIRAICKTLRRQLDVLEKMYDSIEEQSTGWSSLNSRHLNNAARPELPLLLDCIEHVENRLKAIHDIGSESVKLEEWINEQMANTKHRHENAIYAFTIVTVVFLPLSFVCSFLGMNTAGIRDMDSGQWVFWASALPLTFAVVLVALFITDELGHAWAIVRQLLGLREKHAGFAPRRDRGSYWKMVADKKSDWKRLKGRSLAKEQPSMTVSRPVPALRTPSQDPWERPSRRTQTFRSMLE